MSGPPATVEPATTTPAGPGVADAVAGARPAEDPQRAGRPRPVREEACVEGAATPRGDAARSLTRRERLRREVRDDLLCAARELLVPHSTGELSLRAVARRVGIAPSGIYRYFASRQELVAAVAADAYASAGAALERSQEVGGVLDPASRALATAHAYRRWCLSHRAEFSLLFATDAAAQEAEPVPDQERLHDFFATPLAQFTRDVRCGAVLTDQAVLESGTTLVPALERLRAEQAEGLTARDVGVLLSAWASFHGWVSLEVHGPLGWFCADLDDAWDQHARATLRAMGYTDVDEARLPGDAESAGDAGSAEAAGGAQDAGRTGGAVSDR